jgi:hypothetical protein
MKLAIIGSRSFDNYILLEEKTLELYPIDKITSIVSGGAHGADTLAEQFAHNHHIPIVIHKPQWELYGKKAGAVRDRMIVDDADEVLAFWDGRSLGTKLTIGFARKANKKSILFRFNVILA